MLLKLAKERINIGNSAAKVSKKNRFNRLLFDSFAALIGNYNSAEMYIHRYDKALLLFLLQFKLWEYYLF